jgi:TolA-binding protein
MGMITLTSIGRARPHFFFEGHTMRKTLARTVMIGACLSSAAMGQRVMDAPLSGVMHLQLKTAAGEVLAPEALDNQITVIHFWAGWHRGSLDSLAQVKAMLEEYEPQRVRFVSVALDPSREQAREAIAAADAADVPGWTHVFNIEHQPALDTVFFKDNYSIPAVVVLGPGRKERWRGDFAELASLMPELVEKLRPDEAARLAILEQQVGMKVADSVATLQYGREALRQSPKDFVYMLQLVERVPEAFDEVPELLAHGRDLGRALLALSAEEQSAYSDARRIAPQGAMRLDKLVQKATEANLAAGRPEADALTAKTRYDLGLRDLEQGDRPGAYAHFQWVAQNAPSSPAGQAAVAKAAELEADASFIKELADAEASRKANARLQMAKAYLAAGQQKVGEKTLQEVIDTWPDTPEAAEAKKLLQP